MSHTRWLEIKRAHKLCDDNAAIERGNPGCDPACKCDCAFKSLIHNTNSLTYQADLDQCGDKTTMGFEGHAEPKSGLCSRLRDKKVTKGMQTALLSDANQNRPRACLHRHNVHPACPNEKNEGWTQNGPKEVCRLMDSVLPNVDGEVTVEGKRKIWPTKFHSAWDNCFSGDAIHDCLGREGFGHLTAVNRSRLPKGIPSMCFQKEKTKRGDQRAKVCRFLDPVTLVKNAVAKTKAGKLVTHQKVHSTFQSTSSCNIQGTNSLNRNCPFVRQKTRGKGERKRTWAIEMNDARQLHLLSHGRIDTIDHLIQKCNLFCKSWKHWHAAKRHADALTLVAAFDMCSECCKEKMAREAFGIAEDEPPEEKLPTFVDFRDACSLQGLHDDPKEVKCPGDQCFRRVAKLSKKRRASVMVQSSDGSTSTRSVGCPAKKAKALDHVSFDSCKDAKEKGCTASRSCGDLTSCSRHCDPNNIQTCRTARACAFCGKQCHSQCTICKDRPCLCNPSSKTNRCFVNHHNDCCFGLARNDRNLGGKTKKEHKPPSDSNVRANRKRMREHEKNAATRKTSECCDCHSFLQLNGSRSNVSAV